MEIERNVQNIKLEHSELLELVQPAFPQCDQLGEWGLLKGGAVNTLYHFSIGGERFVLRIYVRDRILCGREKALHALVESVVPTPELIYADGKHEPWAYAIFRFAPGEKLFDVPECSRAALSLELGRVLALIHSFKFQKAGLFGEGLNIDRGFPVGSSPYYEAAVELLEKKGNARRRLGEALTEQVLSFMERNQAFFPKVGNEVMLTHSDYKPVNLLYAESGAVTVLDWEFAHAGIGILDFAILLRHRDQFPLDIEALAAGYTRWGGVLPEEWVRSAMITDFVNIFFLLEEPSERPLLFKQLLQQLNTTVANWR